MVGRQTPFLALFVPLILVGMVDGMRGIRQAWPAAVVGGLTFAIGQFACSNYISVELTDIVASLLSRRRDRRAAAGLAARASRCVGERRRPRAARRSPAPRSPTPAHRGRGPAQGGRRPATRRGEIAAAYAPYLIIIVDLLDRAVRADQGLPRRAPAPTFALAGLDVLNAKGEAPTSLTYKFNWRHAAGTLLLISGLLTMVVAARHPRPRAARLRRARSTQLKWATLTVAAVLALAYVMNLSGQTITIGHWIAGRRRHPRVPVADHRLARRRRDRLGHVVELAVRRAAGDGGARRPASTRRCSPRRTPPAACSAR